MTTTLQVQGITCPSCVEHIEDALRMPGITRVAVSLDDETVTVDHDATIASGRLVAALEQAGYGSKPRRGCCCG